MSILLLFLNRQKLYILCLLLASGYNQIVNSQLKIPRIDKIINTINDGTKLLYSTAVFFNTAGRTTAEFNKTVTVIKGSKSEKRISYKKITKPTIKGGDFTNLKWEPVAYFDKQLFPSTIISMATYKEEIKGELEAISRPLGVRIISSYSNIPLNWEIECVEKKYFDKVSGSILYEEANKEVYLMPEILWNYETLGNQFASTPVNVYFRLFDADGKKVEKLESLFLRSINDCIYRYKDMGLDFLFTAFIQEEHPEIDKILKEALDTRIIDAIDGYQGQTEESVHNQVEAIWRVLHDRGFQYSSITATAGLSKDISSQSVRTFHNAIKTRQANCVDGTVVLASILRKIGIHTVLMVTHDHCFLGYYADADKRKLVCLETTLLSNSQFLDSVKAEPERKVAYNRQFLAARVIGMEKFKKYQGANDLVAIDVDKARTVVKPIPFEYKGESIKNE